MSIETLSVAPSTVLDHLREKARDAAPWLKAMGIVNIIVGVPSALALFGLVYIWMGIVLFQAGSAAETASDAELLTLIDKLRTYFIVMTILTILGILIMIGYLFIIAAVFMGMFDALDY